MRVSTNQGTVASPGPSEVLTLAQAKERFRLFFPMSDIDYRTVLLFEGDVTVNGNLRTWADALAAEMGLRRFSMTLFLINGKLTVHGDVDIDSDLIVMGDLHCEVLKSEDEAIHITGDAHIQYAYLGIYNDGSIRIQGKAFVPYVLNSDHSSDFTPEGAILINYFGDFNDCFEYDYTQKDLKRIMVPQVLDANREFQHEKFTALLKDGKSPFRQTLRSRAR